MVCSGASALDYDRGRPRRLAHRTGKSPRAPWVLFRLSTRIIRDCEPAPPSGPVRRGHRPALPAFRLHSRNAMSALGGRRRAGLLIPLFSCPTTASWGIGDIGDLEPLVAWLAGAGQRVLQLLPLNEMASGQQSPYSAISAMAIDPI